MKNKIENPIAELDLKAIIRYETLRTMSANGVSSFLVSVINALIVYVTLYGVTAHTTLNIWLAAIILISILRSLMIVIFHRLDKDGNRFEWWSAVYALLVYGSAICWGVMPLWDVFYMANWTEAFIVFLVAGMSAGGLVSLYPSLVIAIPYQLLILGPLIFVLASSGEPAHVAMTALVCMFLILLIRSTYTLNRAATASIRLEMENNELFKFLLRAKE
ncbi:MAG: hypothetical protein ACSHXZ_09510 [Gammaproteobacteria bacterium]